MYNRRHLLNSVKTCRDLYSVGFPYLYHDVLLTTYRKSKSFFKALSKNGPFIRRLRINEECLEKLYYQKFLVEFDDHNHILNIKRLAAIARYCTNLRVLFLGWNHEPAWDKSVLKLFTQQRTTLQAVVLPTFDMSDLGHSVLRFYATLNSLRQLRLTTQNMGDPLVMDVARSCSELRDVYLNGCYFPDTEVFVSFLKLIPQLEVLHFNNEGCEDDYSNPELHPYFVPDLLSKLPLQNRKLRTLVLRNLAIPHLPHITTESYPTLRVLDISLRQSQLSKIENLVGFLQALQALQILHIDELDLFLSGPDDILLNFIPGTIKVFTSCQILSSNVIIVDLIRKATLFDKSRFHKNLGPLPWDGLDNDIFMYDWEYSFGRECSLSSDVPVIM